MTKKVRNIIKISVGLVVVLVSSMFINSCSMIKKESPTPIEAIQHQKYLSENEAYLLTFNEDDGELLEYASGNEIIFNYEYSSGITICKYQESYFDEKKQETIIKDKKLTFVFMKEEMLYLRQKNLLFQKI